VPDLVRVTPHKPTNALAYYCPLNHNGLMANWNAIERGPKMLHTSLRESRMKFVIELNLMAYFKCLLRWVWHSTHVKTFSCWSFVSAVNLVGVRGLHESAVKCDKIQFYCRVPRCHAARRIYNVFEISRINKKIVNYFTTLKSTAKVSFLSDVDIFLFHLDFLGFETFCCQGAWHPNPNSNLKVSFHYFLCA